MSKAIVIIILQYNVLYNVLSIIPAGDVMFWLHYTYNCGEAKHMQLLRISTLLKLNG